MNTDKRRVTMPLCATIVIIVIALSSGAPAQGLDPFTVEARLERADGSQTLRLDIGIPHEYHLYADELKVLAENAIELIPVQIPPPKREFDKSFNKEVEFYDHTTNFVYRLSGTDAKELQLSVSYQGCKEDLCFPPTTRKFTLALTGESSIATETAKTDQSPAAATDFNARMKDFEEVAKTSGYINPREFIAFLDDVESGAYEAVSSENFFKDKGLFLTIVIVLLGGLALNLTPCVLPMIPVNIAIIGAGAQAKSRAHGLLLGGTYGAGIALAYGALGLVVAFTGTRFGTLNASPWFNLGIGVLFLLLSLSMFGMFHIDFSRFHGRGIKLGKSGSFIAAFALGLVAALLAGACVAPVVISVLLYSTSLYADGNISGLLLPFLLGLGMALPWPFAGAGLSFLPKAGAWMDRVKHIFGVIILLAAIYYGRLGFSLMQSRANKQTASEVAEQETVFNEKGWMTSLSAAMEEAEREQKPIFVDFWAVWCKNCLKMDKTTFKDPDVKKRLNKYIKVKVNADVKDLKTEVLLEHFVDVGLPTYVILKPDNER